MHLLIRQATCQDTDEVSAVLREAARWLERRGMPMWRDQELASQCVSANVDAGIFFIAKSDRQVVGVMKFQLEDPIFWPDVEPGESAFVHRLAIQRRFAGSGTSTELLRWAADRARSLGKIYLRLDCEAARPKLRAVYENFGFEHHSDREVGPYFVSRYQFRLIPNSISYDALAVDYTQHRHIHAQLFTRLLELTRTNSSPRILEVGCGTGNYITALARMTPARCSGVEPSSRMLDVARQRTGAVSWRQASAESLPFVDGSFDFVYSVDVLHHVPARQTYFGEACRVLAAGGRFVTATDNEETIRQRALSHYFPETILPELERYPKSGEIPRLLRAAGFDEIHDEIVESANELADIAPYERKAFSCLHLISEDAFQRGLERLQRDLQAGSIPWISRFQVYHARKP